ncbi:SRPBCC domain-containing protein [Corynebacterium sp. A21]|uniref:SRPBCC domain-containing protein n=1 Tax=Corynebacterium sp. A21 TaxID=3457318 RepID=UPI003FD2E8A1
MTTPESQTSANNPLSELKFSTFGFISKPTAEVYEAVADPEQLSKYFATGTATNGRLATGATVTWDFHDFPGAFPVQVLEAEPNKKILIAWPSETATPGTKETTTIVTFEFVPIDEDTRTKVIITEGSWQPTEAGARDAFGNSMGWTGMLAAMKVWLEHGINLREGFYK